MSDSVRIITEANRTSWNQIAPQRPGDPAEFFAGGGLALDDFEQELAGDVRGRRVLQLACSSGDQVLSWANLGANAVGVDISDVAIDVARRKAAEAGIEAEFLQADMFELPVELREFDLIYFSAGAICWVPDLAQFAAIVADRLRPGGSVLMVDHHPVWEVLAVRGDNEFGVVGDYFGRHTPRGETDDAKRPLGARGAESPPPFSAFIWPVSDVVMAFIGAGLRLEAFSEGGAPALYAGAGGVAANLPAYYVIKASRPQLSRVAE
ncbi:class I SAM-dependent methyltransferase [Kribbella qitaiheensis]|uniref:Class I SAM-dependent methyltransferase n=1 Tax=Kribbella qitaiheensis TaxID=1544730 RepID=A0A7G6X0J0_9ACTN|nr:class I SAM-dependent methyltransferase [Kribbella qitaiheensis]QNE19755.1 class I SAM-dependent methyltransferase [Kribbella qitaiheensis]